MLDKKDPVTMAVTTFVVAFVLLIGILYLAKPTWVLVLNQTTGKSAISWSLVLSYSATFALVCAIAAMVLISNHRGPTAVTTYDVPFAFPAPEMAVAYVA